MPHFESPRYAAIVRAAKFFCRAISRRIFADCVFLVGTVAAIVVAYKREDFCTSSCFNYFLLAASFLTIAHEALWNAFAGRRTFVHPRITWLQQYEYLHTNVTIKRLAKSQSFSSEPSPKYVHFVI